MRVGSFVGNVLRDPVEAAQIPKEFLTEPWYESRYQGCASDGSVRNVMPMRPGNFADNWEGTRVRFIENATTTALAEGDVLIPLDLTAVASIASSADGLTLTGFTNLKPNEWMDGVAYISAATTGDSATARITGNTATEVYVERTVHRGSITGVTVATVQLFHPWRVQKSKSALGITQRVAGVCYGTIPAQTVAGGTYAGGISYYGLMFTRGICTRVKVDAATGATGSQLLVPSDANAGQAEVIVDTNDLFDAAPFGQLLGQMANFDVAVPCRLFCE